MNGVIITSSGVLVRAGFAYLNDSAFDAGTESIRTDVPEPPMVKYQEGNDLMHRWTGTEWETIDNISRDESPDMLKEVPSSGSAVEIDVKHATAWRVVLNADVTFTFVGAVVTMAFSFTLTLVQDAFGGRAVIWPMSVIWPGGSAPNVTQTANAVDVFTFVTLDGGVTWMGFLVGADVR
jgi:hypothetical protein